MASLCNLKQRPFSFGTREDGKEMGSLSSAHEPGGALSKILFLFIKLQEWGVLLCGDAKLPLMGLFAWVEFEIREKLQKEGATGDSCPELRIGTPHLNQP